MGMTDRFVVQKIPRHVADTINKLERGSRIAWLGQVHPGMGNTNEMYKEIMNLVRVEDLHCDFYDLNNDDSIAGNSYCWDINTEWDFDESYDLFVAVRVFYACLSVSQFLRNLNKVTSNGTKVVGSFVTGNRQKTAYRDEMVGNLLWRSYESEMVGDYEVLTSPYMIPMLVQTWIDNEIKNPINEYKFGAKPFREDQVLAEDMFQENGVKITPKTSFREPTKAYIYSVCEFNSILE